MLTPFRIAPKLVLVCATFSLPIAVLLVLMVSGINKDIQFARMEVYGNQYQRILEKLLQHLSEHKQAHFLLNNGYRLSSGQPGAQSPMASIAQQLDADFNALIQVDQELGEQLQTTAAGLAQRKRQHLRPEILQQEWAQLKAAAPGVSERDTHRVQEPLRGRAHDHLIADVRDLIAHIGDTSNLILDPDLDSYYLMDMTLLALPQMQDRLQEVRSYGQHILVQKNIRPEQQTQLNVYAALLQQSDLNRIIADIKTALNEDPNFYGVSDTLQKNLSPALLEELATHMNDFIQLNKRLGTDGPAAVSLSAYQASAQQALLSSYHLWEIAATELDGLLEIRIAHYRHTRLMALLLTLGALLAAILLAVLIIVRSITRPMHKLFSSIAENLEQQVTQRTAELQRANKELESYNYSVSHDLRAPLVNLLGFSRVLKDAAVDLRTLLEQAECPPPIRERGLVLVNTTMHEALHFIQASATRLSGLIDALLRVSRIGRVDFHWQMVDLNSTVQRIVDSMNSMINQRSARVTVQALPPVWGDSDAVEHIFAHLISNALNYLDTARPGIIEIGSIAPKPTPEQTTPGMNTYYVKDNGLGMSDAAQSKLFQIFQRFHPTSAQGEGVGLTLTKRMIERHKGTITVESSVGVGTIWFVSLPCAKPEADAVP